MIKRLKPYILLIPATGFIGIILLGGLYIALMQSLGYFPQIGLEEITLKYYKLILKDENFISSFKFSLYISLVSSIISVFIGTILAYCFLKNRSRKIIKKIISKIPLIVPHSIAAFLIYNMLSQGGILARIFYSLGFISDKTEFWPMILDQKGVGVITTYIWKEIPFVSMIVYNVFSNINNKLESSAKNLGANEWQIFRYIYIPIAMPAIISSFLIIFAYSFATFEVPFILGPTYPKTIAVKAYIEYSNLDLKNRPYSMSINMILITISFVIIWIYQRMFKWIKKYQ